MEKKTVYLLKPEGTRYMCYEADSYETNEEKGYMLFHCIAGGDTDEDDDGSKVVSSAEDISWSKEDAGWNIMGMPEGTPIDEVVFEDVESLLSFRRVFLAEHMAKKKVKTLKAQEQMKQLLTEFRYRFNEKGWKEVFEGNVGWSLHEAVDEAYNDDTKKVNQMTIGLLKSRGVMLPMEDREKAAEEFVPLSKIQSVSTYCKKFGGTEQNYVCYVLADGTKREYAETKENIIIFSAVRTALQIMG